MARIGDTLFRKPGWRPCSRCRTTREYGAPCPGCDAEARHLIESAMTPASRTLWAQFKAAVDAWT